MKTVGIIAEYNPFHNGHLLQLIEVRRRIPDAEIIIAMSGSFTQRGTVAVLDKWQRAESAVRHGASLVLELPTVFATRSAQYFAVGGVRLLDRLGVVETLAFGAECDDLARLERIAKETDADENIDDLRNGLRHGSSYAAALTHAASPDAPARQPNIILAAEYLRALGRIRSSIVPLALPRFAAAHHEQEIHSPVNDAPIASASAIRTVLIHSMKGEATALASALRAVPPDMKTKLINASTYGFSDTSRLHRPLLACLLTDSPSVLRTVAGISEGLENRLRRAALSAHSYEELIEAVRSKRYPRARIRRILLHLLLGLSSSGAKRFDESGPLYARVLAFNDNGRRLLRTIRKHSELPIITRLARFLPSRTLAANRLTPAQEMLSFDLRATMLASLTSSPVGFPPANADYLQSPFYL